MENVLQFLLYLVSLLGILKNQGIDKDKKIKDKLLHIFDFEEELSRDLHCLLLLMYQANPKAKLYQFHLNQQISMKINKQTIAVIQS